jgi:REP element-mobilizing transposase RayT
MVGTLSKLSSYVYEIYANPDHVHILCTLPRTITVAELMSKVKSSSSRWIKTQGITNFSWQDGYGAFSVSSSNLGIIKNYIINQSEHHKKDSFQDELRKFFEEYKVEYDERYVWD